VDPQAGFLDDRHRPHARFQLFAADDIAGTLRQRDQQIERAAAEPHRHAVFQQQPFGPQQLEGAEGQRMLDGYRAAVVFSEVSTGVPRPPRSLSCGT
jgi:hypothetical protein